MQKIRFASMIIIMLWLFTPMVHAETNYVIDELKIGLHKDRTTDSPIIKLVPSGTALTIIERDNELVLVQEPEGARGWVNGKYLVDKKPGRAQLVELESKNAALKKEIELLKSKSSAGITSGKNADKDNASKDLEQQLNSERLKVGELQAQLTDLKAHIADAGASDKLLQEIDQLKQEKSQLINQLETPGIELASNADSAGNVNFSSGNWKQISIIILIIFILGMIGGAFVLDYYNRRRHGGFRV